jgi:dihydrodipicolinate synthase/N-acetylneuraminate lyase
MASELSGVFPVLATPFRADLSADEEGLRAVTRYAIDAGADGVVFPGIASDYDMLASDERTRLVDLVAEIARGRVSLIVGGSAPDVESTEAAMRQASAVGADALMVMAPRTLATSTDVIAFFGRVAESGDVPIMLQNAPPPAGSGLPIDVVLDVVRAVPQVAYVKEEALPSGARISRLLDGAPATLCGVLGGAGGRYITDEIARGAPGTLPAVEVTEMHGALFAAHRAGDRASVRRWFNRMLPILNMQSVFRWALTKEVLRRRGIIECAAKRAAGAELDAGDHQELTEILAELSDVLKPPVVRGAP